MTPTQASLAVRRELEPTHPCIRCGRDGVPMDAGLCELCNPLELSQPSATQMHGIAAVGIVLFVLVLAVAGRAVLSGAGPFTGVVAGAAPAAGGVALTIQVANEGTRDASTTCRVSETPARVGGQVQSVQTPLIRAGESIEFTTLVTRFGSSPPGLTVSCQSP